MGYDNATRCPLCQMLNIKTFYLFIFWYIIFWEISAMQQSYLLTASKHYFVISSFKIYCNQKYLDILKKKKKKTSFSKLTVWR